MDDERSISIEDRMAIHDLIARYGWSLDTGDIDGFVDCFVTDATLCEDVFEEADTFVGHDAIRGMARFFADLPMFPGRQHHVSNILVEGAGPRCHVRAYCMVTDATAGPGGAIAFCGHYDDVVVKQDGRWRFETRLIRHWSGEVLARFPGQDGTKVARKRPTG